jgi:hypothetical protein
VYVIEHSFGLRIYFCVTDLLIVTELVKKFLAFYITRRFMMVLTRIHNWILCSAGRIHSTSPHPVCLNGLLTFQLIFHIHFSSSHLHSHVLPVFSFDHLSRGLVNNANHKAPYCVIFFAMLLPYKTPGTIMC